MKKTKLILILSAIILVCFIGFLYNGFNGNPVSKYLAAKKVESYLNTNYPKEEFKIERVSYDFKFGRYVAAVYSPQNKNIQFSVSPGKDGYVYDEYIEKYAKDRELSHNFSEQISEMVLPIANEKVAETSEATADIYIKKDKYPANAVYTKDMEENFTLNIYFKGEKTSKEVFVDKCIRVRDAILANDFKVERFCFDYRWGIKRDGYSLNIEEKELNSSKEQLLSSEGLFDYGEINAKKK